MDKRWSKTEISHLKKHAATESVEDLAQRFHTDITEVRSKMESLHLTAQEGGSAQSDAAVKQFEVALEKIHNKQWSDAKALLEVVVKDADNPHLSDRARQYIDICLRQEETLNTEDPYLLAVFEKNRGNLDSALEACQGQADDAGRFAYLMASIQALAGREEEAVTLLEKAIDLEPRHRVYAYHDPDFRDLQGLEEFTELVSLTQTESQAEPQAELPAEPAPVD